MRSGAGGARFRQAGVSQTASKFTKVRERSVCNKLMELGGSTLVLCDQTELRSSNSAETVVELDSGLKDFVRDILYMPVLHFLCYNRFLLEGQNPGYPANLDYAVIAKHGV